MVDCTGSKGTHSSIPKQESAVSKREKQSIHKIHDMSNTGIMALYG